MENGGEIFVRRSSSALDASPAFHLARYDASYTKRFGTPMDVKAFEHLFEHSFASVSAEDARGRFLGFASFDECPPEALGFSRRSSWEHEIEEPLHRTHPSHLESSLWLCGFASHALAHREESLRGDCAADDSVCMEEATKTLERILASVFDTLPLVEEIYFMQEASLTDLAPVTTSLLFENLRVMETPSELQTKLYVCRRNGVVPKLSIRRGYIEDYDDLLPLLNDGLPVVGPHHDNLYLASLLERQDDEHFVLVGMDGREFVGVVAITSVIEDLDIIRKSFDLGPFNHLEKRYRGKAKCELESSKNSFRISLFSIRQSHETRAVDFIQAAFDLFHERDYMLVTVPFNAAEVPLQKHFTRAIPVPGCLYSGALFVHHRIGLYQPLYARFGTVEDLPEVKFLCDAVDQGNVFLDAFTASLDEQNADIRAIVFVCQSDVIGACVVSVNTNVLDYEKKYDLSKYLDSSLYVSSAFCTMKHWIVSPVFQPKIRYLCRETLRLLDSYVLFYEWRVTDRVLEFSRELVPLFPRRQVINLEPSQSNFEDPNESQEVGYFISHRLLSEEKICCHARIVVVGASDTALAFIHNLLMIPDSSFTGICLLSPEGIPMYPSLTQSDFFPCGYPFLPQEYNSFYDGSKLLVVRDKMQKLDREKKRVVLLKGGSIAYDFLVMATGRQFTFSPKFLRSIGDQLPAAGWFHLVRGMQLRSFRSYCKDEWSASKSNVIVYGATLEAFCSLQAVIEQGVNPAKVVLVCPPFSRGSIMLDEIIETKFFDILSLNGIQVVRNHVLKAFQSTSNGEVSAVIFEEAALRTGFEFEEPGREESDKPSMKIPCCAFLQCDTKDVDADVLRAATQSSIVFDGRLVVDPEFGTADPTIFASGPLVRFSRRFGPSQFLEKYNAREVGQKLARVLLPIFDPDAVVEDEGEAQKSRFSSIPVFSKPKMTYCRLPGQYIYFHSGSLGHIHGELQCKKRYTDFEGRYLAVYTSKTGVVEGITYFGQDMVELWNLQAIVGLPEKYCNNLVDQFDEGSISDFVKFFREPWAIALYHDRFFQFRSRMREAASRQLDMQSLRHRAERLLESSSNEEFTPEQKDELVRSITLETSKSIQENLLHFLRENKNELPTYYIPPGKHSQ